MKQTMTRMPDELIKKIDRQAEKESRTRSNMIRVLIERALKGSSK